MDECIGIVFLSEIIRSEIEILKCFFFCKFITVIYNNKENKKLPFLDVLVTKKVDNILGHQVYRIPTHTDRYLHAETSLSTKTVSYQFTYT